MKGTKKNALKRLLFICLGLTIITFSFANMRMIDPPGRPGKPVVRNYGPDFCDVEFTPPRENGGSPVTAYWIEMNYRREGGGWSKVGEIASKYTAFKATNVREGATAEFRVRAENKAGLGAPSRPSDPVTFKVR